jgi:hypothetical protein
MLKELLRWRILPRELIYCRASEPLPRIKGESPMVQVPVNDSPATEEPTWPKRATARVANEMRRFIHPF